MDRENRIIMDKMAASSIENFRTFAGVKANIKWFPSADAGPCPACGSVTPRE